MTESSESGMEKPPSGSPSVGPDKPLLSADDLADWRESLAVAADEGGVFFLLEKWAAGHTVESHFDTAAELVAHVKRLIGHPVSIRCMFGVSIAVTKGPTRFLRGDGVRPLPLFDTNPIIEDEEDGYLGVDSDRYGEEVRRPEIPNRADSGATNFGDEDEEFEDEDDDR